MRRRITTAATNNISTSKSSLPVPITAQKKQIEYLTTQEQATHSTYSAFAKTMETRLKDITSASLGICLFVVTNNQNVS